MMRTLFNNESRMPCACSSSDFVRNVVYPVMSAIKRNPCCVIAAIPFVNEMRNFQDDPRLEEMIPPFQGFSKPRSILPTTMLTAYGDAETKRGAVENDVESPLTQPIKDAPQRN